MDLKFFLATLSGEDGDQVKMGFVNAMWATCPKDRKELAAKADEEGVNQKFLAEFAHLMGKLEFRLLSTAGGAGDVGRAFRLFEEASAMVAP